MKRICWICEEEINSRDIPFFEEEKGHSHTRCKDVLDLIQSNQKIREKAKEVLDEIQEG